MKILHVVQGYTPAIGGTELLIQKLSEQLVQKYNDEVTVFTTTAAQNCTHFVSPAEPTLPAGRETLNGVNVYRFAVFNRFGGSRHLIAKIATRLGLPFNDWTRAYFTGPIISGMTRQIAQFEADVIAASSFPFLHMHYALRGGQRSNTPVVLHGALHTTDRWNFDRKMIYQTIRQADRYIANSSFERDYLIERTISPEKIHTIGVGIDPQQFATSNGDHLRRQYQWGQAPVIGFVGQLSIRKGLTDLLNAMPEVWHRYPDAKLLLAGATTSSETLLNTLISRLHPLGANQIVKINNFPETQKASIIAACDLIVYPSQEESFGIVFLEAWASKKPVIGIRAGAIPAIVEDNIDGLLATPNDAADLARKICELLANPAQRHQLAEAGYQKVLTHYTWDIIVNRFRQVYQHVGKNT